jgi:hypothetical protein
MHAGLHRLQAAGCRQGGVRGLVDPAARGQKEEGGGGGEEEEEEEEEEW